MSAHTQDVLGDNARRALDAAAELATKRPRISSKRARTIRPGRSSGVAASSASEAVALSPTSLAPAAGAIRVPDWVKASPVQVVLTGRGIRLGNRAFFLAVAGALTGVLMLLLVINTSLAAGTFELQDARQQMNKLALQEQNLSNQLSEVESPVGLEKKAKALGMVGAGAAAFIDLNSKKIIGDTEAAQAPMVYASAKKKKKPAEVDAATSDAQIAQGTVDPTTGFFTPDKSAVDSSGADSSGASSGSADSGGETSSVGLRPLGLLN